MQVIGVGSGVVEVDHVRQEREVETSWSQVRADENLYFLWEEPLEVLFPGLSGNVPVKRNALDALLVTILHTVRA